MPKTGLYRNAAGLGSPQGEPWQTSGVGPSRLNSKKKQILRNIYYYFSDVQVDYSNVGCRDIMQLETPWWLN